MQKKILTFILGIQCFIFPEFLYAQLTNSSPSTRFLFYNAENLFDIKDDSLTNDEEYLPTGLRYWTYRKLEKKLNHLYKTIIAVGAWQPPGIIGLCEVENRYVLQRLVEETPIQRLHYQIIHQDSPDKRGIDVALLYRKSDFDPIYYEFIPIHFPDNPSKATRDILYAKGVLLQADTVHLFINHWPSRWGGQQVSAPSRNYVADVLRHKVDSLFITNSQANIIIMGDLNDTPEDPSLRSHLGAKSHVLEPANTQLYNMMGTKDKDGISGTHKYQGQWHIFDQIIISGALLKENNKLQIPDRNAHIFKADFLLQEDHTYMGRKPFRTYTGYQYQGGFSDHLPIYMDITVDRLHLTQKAK